MSTQDRGRDRATHERPAAKNGALDAVCRMPAKRWRSILHLLCACLSLACAVRGGEVLRPRDRRVQFDTRGVLIGHSNGIRVFVSPDMTTNLVEVDLRIAAGSRDDPPGKGGLAHFVEHVVFELAAPGLQTIGQALTSTAISHNALTDHDVTHFIVTAPATELARVVGIYAAVLGADCTGLATEVFERERAVVRSELRQRRARDDSAVLTAALYPEDHVYHHGVAGTVKSIEAITPADVCKFIAERYTPGSATLVVSGVVLPEQVQALSTRYLRPLPARPAPERRPVQAWSGGGGGRREVRVEGARPAVALAFPYPPRFHDDELAARHLRVALAAKLASQARGVPEIVGTRVEVIGGRDAPILLVIAESERRDIAGRIEEVLKTAVQETVRLATDELVHQMTSQVLRFETVRAVERLTRRGYLYADYLDASPGYGFFAGDVARIDAMGVHDVQVAASRLFDASKSSTIQLVPGARSAEPRTQSFMALPEEHTASSVQFGEGVRMPGLPAAPKIERYTLSNGLDVILAPTSSMPVVDIRLVIGAGHGDTPESQPFLAVLAAMLGEPGDWITLQDAARMTLAGGQVDVDVDARTTVFSTMGLSIYVDYLLEGLSARVVRGQYRSESLQDLKRAIVAVKQRTRDADRLRAETKGRFMRALLRGWGGCADMRDVHEVAVGRYSTIDMARFKKSLYRAKNATLIVAGKFDMQVAKSHVEANFGRGGPREYASWDHEAPSRSGEGATWRVGTANERGPVVEVDEENPMLEIAVGFSMPAHLREDPAAAILLNHLVEREVAAVRTRLGASYGLHSRLVERCGVETLLIAGDIEPTRASEAREEIFRGLERLKDPATLSSLLQAARIEVLRRLHADLGDSQAIAQQLEYAVRRSLTPDAYLSIGRRVSELDTQTMAWITQRALGRPVLYCRGPRVAAQQACDRVDPR